MAEVTEGITAGTVQTQAGATPLKARVNRVTVGNANDGVALQANRPGLEVVVIAATGNALNVWPAVGDAIDALGKNNAYSLADGKIAHFFCTKAGKWHSQLGA